MNTPLENFVDRIFVINLDRRQDRWAHCVDQFAKLGLTNVERFPGWDGVIVNGKPNGNAGCTASHRSILELTAYHKWRRVLVFEDDFEAVHSDTQERFAAILPELPEKWDLLYLGGHYAEEPISRHSKHVIRCGRMHTTSSYIVTSDHARRMAPNISGIGPIDTLFSGFARDSLHYILQPRLFVQYSSFSDLTERDSSNAMCMLDTRHENMV